MLTNQFKVAAVIIVVVAAFFALVTGQVMQQKTLTTLENRVNSLVVRPTLTPTPTIVATPTATMRVLYGPTRPVVVPTK